MSVFKINKIPYAEIENGALILYLLNTCSTWNELCAKYENTESDHVVSNTNANKLMRKLIEMRELKLISFETKTIGDGECPVGKIKGTGLWSDIRVALGGMRVNDIACLSSYAKGMAVIPEFGRPRTENAPVDVFVIMPFKKKLKNVYNLIRKLDKELGIVIGRADDVYATKPFMDKVWQGICGSRLVIADCTEQNPNVFYEIGIAHTVGKPIVFITRCKSDIPSDIQQFTYINYRSTPNGKEKLIRKLKKVIREQLQL